MQRLGTTVFYWFLMALGLTSLAVAVVGFAEAENVHLLPELTWGFVAVMFGFSAVASLLWLLFQPRQSGR